MYLESTGKSSIEPMEKEKAKFCDLTDGVSNQFLQGLKKNFIVSYQNAVLSVEST